jgi:hypothetical protein
MAVTMLGMSAEGAAGAQSVPARTCNPNDPTLACMQLAGAAVGPELAAARASLGGATKKTDNGAAVDWNSLANRQTAAGTTANGMTSSAGVPIPSAAGGVDSLQMLHIDATGATSTNAGASTRIAPVDDSQQSGAPTSGPAPHAESVIRGQINPAARACYENDPDSKSKQPGRLVIFIKLTPTGEVDSVNVASNTGLSPSVTTCITTAAGAAKFGPPGANGSTVRAAFAFGQEAPAAPVVARAKDAHKGAQAASASARAASAPVAEDVQPTKPSDSLMLTTPIVVR